MDRQRGALGQVLFRRSLPEQGLRVSPHPELGLDLSTEFPKPLTTKAVQASDVVITMGYADRYELIEHAGLPTTFEVIDDNPPPEPDYGNN